MKSAKRVDIALNSPETKALIELALRGEVIATEMSLKDDRRKDAAWSLLGQIEIWRIEYGRPAMKWP